MSPGQAGARGLAVATYKIAHAEFLGHICFCSRRNITVDTAVRNVTTSWQDISGARWLRTARCFDEIRVRPSGLSLLQQFSEPHQDGHSGVVRAYSMLTPHDQ